MHKKINNDGFQYVDLGLPSGTLWATCNVGASKPSDYGLYFQWGDTQGYTANQVGTGEGQKKFASDWSDYKWGVSPNFTKYTTLCLALELNDDAAHVNMGGDWHIPSPTQIRELIGNTTTAWTTLDGANGRLFTSKKDSSKSIFIPAAGGAWGGLVQLSGDYGSVWSSMLDTADVGSGQYLNFYSGDVNLGSGGYRCDGLSVRGVIDSKQDKNGNANINKENEAMLDKYNSLKAFDNEIENLQEKIKDIQKKKRDCIIGDYSKKYTGKYVKITTYDMAKEELTYINECIYVRDVSAYFTSDNLALTLHGQGFRYLAGDYLDDIEGNFSETYSKTIYENWITDGLVKLDIISKEEYKKEVNKMVNFITKDFDDVEVTVD